MFASKVLQNAHRASVTEINQLKTVCVLQWFTQKIFILQGTGQHAETNH